MDITDFMTRERTSEDDRVDAADRVRAAVAELNSAMENAYELGLNVNFKPGKGRHAPMSMLVENISNTVNY